MTSPTKGVKVLDKIDNTYVISMDAETYELFGFDQVDQEKHQTMMDALEEASNAPGYDNVDEALHALKT